MQPTYPPLPQLQDVDLRLLRVFMAVVRNRGFTAAQLELNINQPTISVQMAQLEDRLRMTLCHRGRSGFKLTPQGEQVYEAAQRMFRSIEQFRSDIASTQGGLSGELHIGAVDAVATSTQLNLPMGIRRFSEIAGNVELHVQIRSPQALLRHLLEERIHVAIAPFSSVPPSIQTIELHTETQVLYCAQGHPFFELDEERITKAMLAETPYAARDYLQNWSPPDSPHFHRAAVTGDMEAMLLYILSGKFIGYLPKHYAQKWVDEGAIRPLLDDELSYDSQFYLAYRGNQKNSVVLEFLRQFKAK